MGPPNSYVTSPLIDNSAHQISKCNISEAIVFNCSISKKLESEKFDKYINMVSEDVKAYVSSLADLTFNSKPLIDMLTMLADENVAHAAEIVEVVENHLTKVKTDVKLPILYLIDCIVKNVGGSYTELFSHNIVATFCSVFRVVDKKNIAEMFKLRQTWNDVFSPKKLYAIDVQISLLDPAWPVTAPLPPSSSIHLNPKFLKNTPATPTHVKSSTIPAVAATNADPVTLDMQQQLIQKQKELELLQKKVELELLQTKVRLREQISGGNLPGSSPSISQNVLLKPEVAKQLLPPSSRAATIDDNKNIQITTLSRIPTLDNPKSSGNSISLSVKNQRMQITNSSNNGPRIQPANSALVAAAVNRPIRDPRLLRQQQQQSQQIHQKQTQNTSNNIVQLENKNNLDSSNKVVNSKSSVRDIQNDPRLKSANDNVHTQKLNDMNKAKSKILLKQRSDKNQIRSSRNNKSHLDDSKLSKSSSSSSLDSPKKSKPEKSSPSKSPSSRSRRKEPPASETKFFKSTREPKASKSDTALPIFKDTKGSKSRNYVRRNRSPEFSPEPSSQDIDLRLSGPPEKQPRIIASPEKSVLCQNEPKEPSPIPSVSMDVDLRQLPAVIGKKRLSSDSQEQNSSKKSKTEIFDVLFGSEDTDLRKLSAPTPERPPTPPPPIISSSENIEEETEIEPQPQKSDLEVVRAKLAANLKKSNAIKSFRSKTEDRDLRVNQVTSTTDITNKIIISKAEGDKIKAGGMTSLQQKELMNKIIAQIEVQKLKEAKNYEEALGNISLTPISDDEFEADFNEDNNKTQREDSPISAPSFGDKDERILPMNMVIQDENFPKRFGRENRRGGLNWRGARGRRHWDAGLPLRPPMRPWMQPPMQQPPMNNWTPSGNFRPPFSEIIHPHDVDQIERRSPDVSNDIVVESASQEDIKTITIDGLPRDIRYYDEVAIIFMNWDDPREISFQDGTRRVIFNDIDMYMMNFNEPYREYRIGESLYQVRLGGPSREIYIDYKPYECYFGGPGITIDLDGKVTAVKLDGPPPQVKIGDCRTDLVAGKIKLIIDAKTIVPIFLDSKLQSFTFNGEKHTVKFCLGLKGVLINDEHFDVQFGGLPKPVMLKNKRHYIRFSVLPKGLKPGQIHINGLESDDVTSSPRMEDNLDVNEPALPVPQRIMKPYDPNMSPDNSSSGNLLQNVLQQQNINNLDFLTNVISSSEQTDNVSSYQVENLPASQQPENIPNSSNNMFNLNSINDLFQKLVASGMVTTGSVPVKEKQPVLNQNRERTRHNHKQFKKNLPIKLVTFAKPEQLKLRQGGLYDKLYSGMQCSSCGMRFPPEQSMYYSQHLDWHFRQNRRGKKNARVASSRKWYYSVGDWQNYEEIENLEEREKNYFDQQQLAESGAEISTEITELPSVTADPELQDICEVCGDKFEIFFNEDKEEWQFRNSIRSEEKLYHPICYDEYQQTLQAATLEDASTDKGESDQIPGIEIVLDDDEEMEKSEEVVDEVILDESDESKQATDDKAEEEEPTKAQLYEDEDDDVIIKEETIEQIILDDDDDKMDEEESQLSLESSSPAHSPKMKEVTEVIDDGFVDVNEGLLMLQNGGPIKVKSEPVDEDEIPEENIFETSAAEEPDTMIEVQEEPKELEQTPTTFVPSIDGNLEMDANQANSVCGKIKINIHKPLPVIPAKDSNKDMFSESDTLPETVIDPSQPLPPGEEPILLKLKPALQGVQLKKLPPVQKGSELTGMCSIM